MKLRRRGLLLIALAVMLPVAAQANSGFGRFHALVIGNQNYRHLTTLQTPLADAKAVADVLKTQYGFTVDLLLDKSRDEIKLALSELRKTMTDERDNLLIYYAGHGYLDERTSTGYWQPVDAEKDNDVYWLPTDEISRLLKAVRARHVLIVADSCYSGSLLMRDSGARLPAAASRDEWLKRMQAKRSRTALTSGGEEPVADGGGSGHSVFAKALLEVLRENKEILDGDSLFDRIKRPVILNAEQTPLYGDIKMTGHEMGDFLLVPKELQEGGSQEQSEGKADLSFLKRGEDVVTEVGLSDKPVSVSAGVGGMIGNEWDEFDQRQLSQAYESSPSGQTTTWVNPDSGNNYQVIPHPAYSDKGSNQICRKAEIVCVIDGETKQIEITGCRDANDNWQIQ